MCGNSTIWAKLAFAVILIGFILHTVSFATNSWMVYQTETVSNRVGLWKMKSCVSESCSEDEVNSSLKSGTFTATQAFAVLALILFIAAVISTGAYLCVASARGSCMAMIAMALCFSACFCAFVSMFCWLDYVPDPYVISWSFGLTVIAAILALIAGLLLVPEVLDDGGGRPPRVSSPPNSRFMMR